MSYTAVIMQPTYLPWIGYFDLIDQSDVFVFLDDAQFSKQSWHQRNRIRTPKGLEWLTVPIKRAGRGFFPISEAETASGKLFPNDHLRAIQFNYERAPFYDRYYPQIRQIYAEEIACLGKLNIRLIRWIADQLGLVTDFRLSSELRAEGSRSELMVDLCRKVGARSCLSTIGAASYLAGEYDPKTMGRLELRFHNYDHPSYRQQFEPFIPYASAIDLILNEGECSLEIIRSGRREALSRDDALNRSVRDDFRGGTSS